MVNNNLNINLNSTIPLNSINYKSNQYRESFPYEYNKIQLKMLQRDDVVMVELKVLVMEMMIPMKSDAMVMTMAMISPLWKGISSVDFSLPESFSLSGVLRPAEAAVSNSEPPFT
jgi:protein tyrosine phosphatase